MKNSMKKIITGSIIALGLLSTTGIATPIANAAATNEADNTAQYELPHVTRIETGNFYYEINKPIGFQTLSGISLLMLLNPDGIIRNSQVKVTMSDGTQLYQYDNENGFYFDASQVKTYVNVR
ncbi:hypothetical protein [Companilactobacillus mishanensis]|uniref:Uncharacterized protein n=1 Tax=Companilactobacillus mishanensis TaxID=2486008 RepID=A0ABW9P9Q7_9LACO|nr:hypothetical protein [Companilactobacillus mishanensis]MQS45943.1 hypothetical protein [Companilactobacillus mishanensis]